MPAHRRKINTGDRFNLLTIVKEIEPYIVPSSNQKTRKFECRCECGVVKNITLQNLLTTKSCGCIKPIISREINLKHDMWKSPEYNSWRAMKSRCLNPNHLSYKNYGGRGITITSTWINSFETFIKDMGIRPTLKHTLDRIDNDGNYEPSNCRWSTPDKQANNRRKRKEGVTYLM
jgi:hypothetical protein